MLQTPVTESKQDREVLKEGLKNFCPSCENITSSRLLEIDGKVYLEKDCCTEELVHVENDPEFYKEYINNTEIEPPVSSPKNYKEVLYKNPNYATSSIHIYVTTQCNMDCPICYLKWNGYHNDESLDMDLDQIKKVAERYESNNLCICGGEVTKREDLPEIIKTIKENGNIPGIITNGLKLKDRDYVEKLKEAGLEYIGLQFDGFDRTANLMLRGQDTLGDRLEVLKNVSEVGGMRTELVSTIDKQSNGTEMANIIDFALGTELIDKIHFVGLDCRGIDEKETTKISDMVGILERDGYLSRNYFLELVKMYNNIDKTLRKLFNSSPFEDKVLGMIPGHYNKVHFKKGGDRSEPLLKMNEINRINNAFEEALNRKSRVSSLLHVTKKFKDLISTSLKEIFKDKILGLDRTDLEVSFHELSGVEDRLLNAPRKVVPVSTEFSKDDKTVEITPS